MSLTPSGPETTRFSNKLEALITCNRNWNLIRSFGPLAAPAFIVGPACELEKLNIPLDVFARNSSAQRLPTSSQTTTSAQTKSSPKRHYHRHHLRNHPRTTFNCTIPSFGYEPQKCGLQSLEQALPLSSWPRCKIHFALSLKIRIHSPSIYQLQAERTIWRTTSRAPAQTKLWQILSVTYPTQHTNGEFSIVKALNDIPFQAWITYRKLSFVATAHST